MKSIWHTCLLEHRSRNFYRKIATKKHRTNRKQHPALDTFLDAVEHDLFELKPAPVRDNLTTRERQACKMLSRRNDFIIKSAGKGSGTLLLWIATGTSTNAYDNSTTPGSTNS